MVFKDLKSRRMFLKFASFQLALPFLASALPRHLRAAPNGKKFIGVFFPNGAYMPEITGSNGKGTGNYSNGNWHWNNPNGLLSKIKNDNNIKDNIMILRNIHGFSIRDGGDTHWANTASFLSSKISRHRAAKKLTGLTLDQMIARESNKPIKSIIVGPQATEVRPHDHHAQSWLNNISWAGPGPDDVIAPSGSPKQLFNQIINKTTPISDKKEFDLASYKLDRKKLILDAALPDIKRLRRILSSEDRTQLQSYEHSLEEIIAMVDDQKASLDKPKNTCDKINLDFSNEDKKSHRMRLYQKLIVHALKCDLTDVSTIMYGSGVNDSHYGNYKDDLGFGTPHHAVAHYLNAAPGAGRNGIIKKFNDINSFNLLLLQELLNDLKNNGILDKTLVLYSSNMSDGHGHGTKNLPTLMAGGSSFNLDFGKDHNLKAQPRSNILYTIGKEFNLNNNNLQKNAFGSLDCEVTGTIDEIIKS